MENDIAKDGTAPSGHHQPVGFGLLCVQMAMILLVAVWLSLYAVGIGYYALGCLAYLLRMFV